MQVDVELPVPKMSARIFEPTPVDVAAEPIHQCEPGCFALVARMARMRVEPMLEHIDGGHPREEFDAAFQGTTLPDRPDYERANAFLVKARRSMVE